MVTGRCALRLPEMPGGAQRETMSLTGKNARLEKRWNYVAAEMDHFMAVFVPSFHLFDEISRDSPF